MNRNLKNPLMEGVMKCFRKKITMKEFRSFVETVGAVARSDPQVSDAVFRNAKNVVVRNGGRVVMIVLKDFERHPVEAVQAVLRSEPKKPFPILKDRVDRVL